MVSGEGGLMTEMGQHFQCMAVKKADEFLIAFVTVFTLGTDNVFPRVSVLCPVLVVPLDSEASPRFDAERENVK